MRAAVEILESAGPALGRPLVDTLGNSRLANLKELRPRGGHLRVLFVFDPRRVAILLLGGDKTGAFTEWYVEMIPLAERLYDEHIAQSARRRRSDQLTRPKARPVHGARKEGQMARSKSFRQLAKKIDADPERRARVEEHKRVMLAELRQELDLTQTDLAEQLHVTQRGVSHVEHEPNPRVGTVSDYVAALGGRLELRAVFEDRTVDLTLPHKS